MHVTGSQNSLETILTQWSSSLPGVCWDYSEKFDKVQKFKRSNLSPTPARKQNMAASVSLHFVNVHKNYKPTESVLDSECSVHYQSS